MDDDMDVAKARGLGGGFGGSSEQKNVFVVMLWQLYALLFKNFVLFRRSWASSLVQVLAPVVCVLLFGMTVFLANKTNVDRDPAPIVTLGAGATTLPRCKVFDVTGGRFGNGRPFPDADCLTIAYSPSTTEMDSLMQTMASLNGLSFADDFEGFASKAALVAHVEADVKPIFAGVLFSDDGVFAKTPGPDLTNTGQAPSTVVPYEIWYNATVMDGGFLPDAGDDTLLLETLAKSSYVLQVQRAVNEALVAEHTGDAGARMTVGLKPHVAVPNNGVPQASDAESDEIFQIEALGSLFYLLGIMITFIIAMRQVASEKDNNTLTALRMMGLYESCYWLSWFIHFSAINLASATLMTVGGKVVDIPVFVHTDATWMFTVLFLYLQAMSALAMALGAALPSAKMTSMVGFLMLAVAVLFQLFVSLQVFSVIDLIWDPYTKLPGWGRGLINLYPPLLFAKMDNDMFATTRARIVESATTAGEFEEIFREYAYDDKDDGAYRFVSPYLASDIDPEVDYEAVCANLTAPDHARCYRNVDGCQSEGFVTLPNPTTGGSGTFEFVGDCRTTPCSEDWSKMATAGECLAQDGAFFLFTNEGGLPDTLCECQWTLQSDADSARAMFGASVLFVFLAWYLGQVFTYGHGRSERPWFLFTPWFWLSGYGVKSPFAGASKGPSARSLVDKDDDVKAEEAAIHGGERSPEEYPVVIDGLVKDFGGGLLSSARKPFRAVDGLTVALRRGEVFALLGHNGAGKTTAISQMSGMLALSGGDCNIFGNSVKDSLQGVRHEISVCPQHDILFDQLTAMEHLRFYGHFQGMALGEVKREGDRLLAQVHLDKLKRPAGQYSGGMKRRLSMTIAALGRQKRILFLDEPTTGLDPQNQRHVWDLINDLKKDRVVVLTTHLMEEADTLGDRIGIMSDGRLVALGTGLHLKRKFGGNYKVTLTPADELRRGDILDDVRGILPQAVPGVDALTAGSGPMLLTVPEEAFSQAPALFRWIEAETKTGAIKDMGLQQTSLEDVFISLDDAVHRGKTKLGAGAGAGAGGAPPMSVEMVDTGAAAGAAATGPVAVAVPVSEPVGANGGEVHFKGFDHETTFSPGFKKQFKALFRKSVTLQRRQHKTVCCQLFIPLVIISLMFVIQYFLEKELKDALAGVVSAIEVDDDFVSCQACVRDQSFAVQNLVDFGGVQSNTIVDFVPLTTPLNATYQLYYDASLVAGAEGFTNFPTAQSNLNLPGGVSTADFYSLANPLFEYCVNDAPGFENCAGFEAAQSSAGGFVQDGEKWFASYLLDSRQTLFASDSRPADGGGMKIMVGAANAALAAQLGGQCANDGELSPKPTTSSGASFSCFSPGTRSFVSDEINPQAADGMDGSASTTGGVTCAFANGADASATALVADFEAFLAASTGFLANFPARLIQTEFRDGGPSPHNVSAHASPALCPVADYASFAALGGAFAGADGSAAVNEILFQAQTARRDGGGALGFEYGRSEEDWVEVRNLLQGNFPNAVLLFNSLNAAAGAVDVDFQTFYDPDVGDERCSGTLNYFLATVPLVSVFGGNENECDEPAALPSGTGVGFRGPEGPFGGNGVEMVHHANFVLNGLASALLRASAGAASSPLAGAAAPEVTVGVNSLPAVAVSDAVADALEIIDELNKIMGSLMVPFATSFLLPVLVFHVVHEKEHKLRALLLMMGMKMRVYWFVQYVFDVSLAFATLLLVYILCAALGITILSNHQFGVVLLLFFLWANVMTAFAFFISTFFSRSRNANIVLYLFVFASVIASNIVTIIVFEEKPFLDAPTYWIMWPQFAYYRCIYLLAIRSFFWEDMGAGDEFTKLLGVLVLQTLTLLLVTFYLDQVWPYKEFGVKRGVCFCFEDAFNWAVDRRSGGGGGGGGHIEGKVEDDDEDDDDYDDSSEEAGEDADVVAERRLVKSEGAEAMDAPVRFVKLNKRFGSLQAVSDLYLHLPDKQCTALLGPNGAGKSTAISMATGLIPPTRGTAFVNGYDIRTQMQQIYSSIGVCPQHDVFWPELTVREHVLLYVRLKGVDRADERRVADLTLQAVELTLHAHKRARQLSGGQRRRLSIAQAFVGNPRVVFLDEPTTGVDPNTRRAIEELILNEKTKRCVLLTSHSMPEVEILSDNIAIMAHGKLRTIGTANQLKAKFSEGFKLLMVVTDEETAMAFVETSFPSANLESKVNAKLTYRIDTDAGVSIADVFEVLTAGAATHGIADYGVRATSLEEVFIQIASESEAIYGTA